VEKGTNQAIETWEGTERSRGERQEPEQALCFGVELSGSALLASGEVAAQAEILLGPLREQLP
jgi:exodeoxyribonuclease V gamma subunit